MNDPQGQSGSSDIAQFYRSRHFVLAVCSNSLQLAPIPRYYHFYSVRNCLRPSEVLQFRQDSWQCTTHTLSISAKFWKSVMIWQSYRQFKGENFFETQRISMYVYHWTSSDYTSRLLTGLEKLLRHLRVLVNTCSSKTTITCLPNKNTVNTYGHEQDFK